MSDSPEAIRANIDRTRQELGRDVDALADKVTPSKIAHRQTDKVKGAFSSLRNRVMGAADDVGSSVHNAGSSIHGAGSAVASGASEAGHRVAAKAQGNPLAVGLIAFGVGLVAAALIPASEKEKRVAENVKEQAQPLLEEAQSAAREVGEHLKEPAQEAVAAVKESATDAAATVKEEATGSAQSVADRAREARENVADNG